MQKDGFTKKGKSEFEIVEKAVETVENSNFKAFARDVGRFCLLKTFTYFLSSTFLKKIKFHDMHKT